MTTVSFEKWQDCVDYFEPAEGTPPASPDREEFSNVRRMVEQVSASRPPLSGEKSEGEQLPRHIVQGVSQMVDHTARCIAALHAKLPKVETAPAAKWQECLDHFAPASGQPPAGPDREEFLRLREVANQIGTPCALILGGKLEGIPVPSDVVDGVAQIVQSFEQRVAALHAKLPKITPAAEVERVS